MFLNIITEGIDSLINYYRNIYMIRNLNALDSIHKGLIEYKKFENSSLCMYLSEKSEFLTKIRHFYYSFSKNVPSVINNDLIPSKGEDVPNYSMGNLISDCESMVKVDHIKNLTYFIDKLDDILDKTNVNKLDKVKESVDIISKSSEPSEVVVFNSSRVDKALKSPYSRISYRLGEEILNVSI
jgi:hypothetical protein